MSLQTFDNILRFIIYGEIIFMFFSWLLFAIKNRNKKGYSVAPILFSIHASIFFTLAGLNLLSKEVYFIWRDFITMHGMLIIILFRVLCLPCDRKGG